MPNRLRSAHLVQGTARLRGPRDGIGGEIASILENVLHGLDDHVRQRVRVEVHHRRDKVCLADHLLGYQVM